MKLFKQLKTGFAGLALALVVAAGHGGVASAACNWNYTGNTMTTTNTPVFNSICGVPGSIGDESDFLRIRPGQSGGVTNANAGTNTLYGNALNATCNDGERFDIRTYIHNDAEPQYNSGAGTGIARNVTVGFNSPINTTASTFNFSSRIAASNAAAVNDTTSLTCGGAPVTLRLVAGSAKIYHETSAAWTNVADGVATGTTPIGDTVGGTDIRGCWDYRVLVGFTVEVERPQPVQASASCDLLAITAAPERRVTVSQLRQSSNNATLTNIVINWGDGRTNTFNSIAAALGATHQYASNGRYTITATMNFNMNGQNVARTSAACSQTVAFDSEGGRVTTPSNLPNVGPGGTAAAAFSAVTVAGGLAHRYFLGRRLGRQ